MSRQNEQLYEASVGGFPSERRLLSLKKINREIDMSKKALQEDPEDIQAKDRIAVYERQINSIARLKIVRVICYRGGFDKTWKSKTFPNNTSLHAAAKFGHAEICTVLLSKGWDVDSKNLHGQTPLILAALAGRVRCTEELLKGGANILQKDRTFHSAAAYAVKNVNDKNRKAKNCTKILKLLRDAHAKRQEARSRFQEQDQSATVKFAEAATNYEVDYGVDDVDNEENSFYNSEEDGYSDDEESYY